MIRNNSKKIGIAFLIFVVGLLTFINAVSPENGFEIRFSYPESVGTGIAISQDGTWIMNSFANITKGHSHTMKTGHT